MKRRMLSLLAALTLLCALSACGEAEEPAAESQTFTARLVYAEDASALVSVTADSPSLRAGELVSFGTKDLAKLDAAVGDLVCVTFNGNVAESWPCQIGAESWRVEEKTADPENWMQVGLQTVDGENVTAQVLDGFYEGNRITFPAVKLTPAASELTLGSVLLVHITGDILETDPAIAEVTEWIESNRVWSPEPERYTEPPQLYLDYTHGETAARLFLNATGTGWNYQDEGEEWIGFCADALPVPDWDFGETYAPLLRLGAGETAQAALSFAVPPKSVRVLRWDAAGAAFESGVEVALDEGGILPLDPAKDAIYGVIAVWEEETFHGDAMYGFAVDAAADTSIFDTGVLQ